MEGLSDPLAGNWKNSSLSKHNREDIMREKGVKNLLGVGGLAGL